MHKLADISQFESLMNGRAVVENGWDGRKVADHIFADPNKSKKKGNRQNYDAVMQKAAGVMRNPNIPPDVKTAIYNGFEQFARFCYNIKADLADSIRIIKVRQFVPNKMRPFSAGETFRNEVRIPMRRPSNEDGWQQRLAGTVAHELMHGLENCNHTVHKALLPKNMPFRRTVRVTHLFDRPFDNDYYEPAINVRAKDRLRAWIAQNIDAGVLGGAGQNIAALCSRKEIKRRLDKIYDKKKRVTYGDVSSVLYEYMKKYCFDDSDFEKIKRVVDNPNSTSEYLTYFMSQYANPNEKIPLLYALDAKRLIGKINKLAKKQSKQTPSQPPRLR